MYWALDTIVMRFCNGGRVQEAFLDVRVPASDPDGMPEDYNVFRPSPGETSIPDGHITEWLYHLRFGLVAAARDYLAFDFLLQRLDYPLWYDISRLRTIDPAGGSMISYNQLFFSSTLTLFTSEGLERQDLVHLWDVMLFEGPRFLFAAWYVMLRTNRGEFSKALNDAEYDFLFFQFFYFFLDLAFSTAVSARCWALIPQVFRMQTVLAALHYPFALPSEHMICDKLSRQRLAPNICTDTVDALQAPVSVKQKLSNLPGISTTSLGPSVGSLRGGLVEAVMTRSQLMV